MHEVCCPEEKTVVSIGGRWGLAIQGPYHCASADKQRATVITAENSKQNDHRLHMLASTRCTDTHWTSQHTAENTVIGDQESVAMSPFSKRGRSTMDNCEETCASGGR